VLDQPAIVLGEGLALVDVRGGVEPQRPPAALLLKAFCRSIGERPTIASATRCSISRALPSRQPRKAVHSGQGRARAGPNIQKKVTSVSLSPNSSESRTRRPSSAVKPQSCGISPPGGSARRCAATRSMCRRSSISSASSAVRALR
jgi:hypothetical protein